MAYPITKAEAEKMVLSANGAKVTGDSQLCTNALQSWSRKQRNRRDVPLCLFPVQVQGGKRMYTCALRPTGVYGDGDELIRDFYKQCVQRGGVVITGVPEHIEHGRVYAGEADAAATSAFYVHPRITPAAFPLCVCALFRQHTPGLAALYFLTSPLRLYKHATVTEGLKAEAPLSPTESFLSLR